MDLQKFREKYVKFIRTFGNLQGYIEYDETYAHVTCEFVSKFSETEDQIFIYKNLEKIVSHYEDANHEEAFFRGFMNVSTYAKIETFIVHFPGDETVICQLCWRVKDPKLLLQLFAPIEDLEFFETVLFDVLFYNPSDSRTEFLHELLTMSDDNFYWKGHLLTDEYALDRVRKHW